MQQSL